MGFEPSKIEPSEGQIRIGPIAFALDRRFIRTVFVEAKDSTIGQNGEIAVGARTGLKRLDCRPCFSIVAAETDGHVASGRVLSLDGARIGKKQKRIVG